MKAIFNLIVKKYSRGMEIPLIREGHYYTFIEVSKTIVHKITYNEAIHYRISKANTKKITALFIELTYEYFLKNGNIFPSRDWYKNHSILKYEYKSRPCNYSVAKELINKVLKK